MSDWQTINLVYPGLETKYDAEVAAGIVTDKPIVPNCGICVQPPARWLIGFDPAGLAIDNSQPLQGDGYLAKSGGATVLHEGVPYITMTPGTNVITTVEPLPTPAFYPAGRLEVDGGGDDDVVRATISDATGYQWQAAHRYDLPPPFNPLNSVNLPLKDMQKLHAPNWYTMPVIPVIDAQPIVLPTATPAGMPMLASLRVTLSDPPIPPGPYTTPGPYTAPGANKNPNLYDKIRLYKSAVATLFEAGRGPGNVYRKTQTRLLRTASGFSGDLLLDNPKLDDADILDGSLYVTAGERYVPPDKPAKTWALASYSLSCNIPTMFMGGMPPATRAGWTRRTAWSTSI